MKTRHFIQFMVILGVLSMYACGTSPESNFRYEPVNPKVGEEVHFINLSENAGRYSWNLGDMNISNKENPVHIYEFEGDFIIDLLAMKGLKSDEMTVTIHVEK